MPENHAYSADELRILESLRAVTPDDGRLTPPPDSVWSAIAAGAAPETLTVAPDRTPHRRSVNVLRFGLVAATVVAAVVAVSLLRTGVEEQVVARAPLSSDGLDGAPVGLAGNALVRERAGSRTLHVDLEGLRPTSGEYLELWLITPDVSGMVSLGAARPDGDYELPAGLNVEEYPIVDVSTEPYDGDPKHSGGSLLRGVLDA